MSWAASVVQNKSKEKPAIVTFRLPGSSKTPGQLPARGRPNVMDSEAPQPRLACVFPVTVAFALAPTAEPVTRQVPLQMPFVLRSAAALLMLLVGQMCVLVHWY